MFLHRFVSKFVCIDETFFFSYPGQENLTGSVVLDFISGTACLVLTSGALVLNLFSGQGYEKYNLLHVVKPRPISLSLGWSAEKS